MDEKIKNKLIGKKVYCTECKYYKPHKTNNDFPYYTDASCKYVKSRRKRIFEGDHVNPPRKWTVKTLAKFHEDNKNNDCPFYKRSFKTLIISLIDKWNY